MNIHERVTCWVNRDDAERRLGIVALAEGVLRAFNPQVMLVPMAILKPSKVWRYVVIATVGSVLGAGIAYVVGWVLWLTLGQGFVMAMGVEGAVEGIQHAVQSVDVTTVLVAGLSPLPFKVVALGLGVFQAHAIQMFVAALIARGARFVLMGWLVWRHGPTMKPWIEQKFDALTMLMALALLFVLVVIKILAM
ncbi:MAG: hypothetical protein WAZ18_02385 [Alphaproteobacteria bacterium]